MMIDKTDLAGWGPVLLCALMLGCGSKGSTQASTLETPQDAFSAEQPIETFAPEDRQEADPRNEARDPNLESAKPGAPEKLPRDPSNSTTDQDTPPNETPENDLADAARSAEEAWLRNSERWGPDPSTLRPGTPRGITGSPGSSPSIRVPSSRTSASTGGSASTQGSSGGPLVWGGTTISAQPLNSNFRGRGLPPLGSQKLWLLTLKETGTGWTEEFLLQVPHHPGLIPGEVHPLLVAFHRFGNSMFDIPANTDYPQATSRLGWYLLAPLGAATINFASRESQINTRLAIEFVLNNYDVDEDRIYGVGHSMGGGNALNFAARHTDLSGPTFAAVVNHTGTLSQNHSYTHDCAPGGGACLTMNPWEFWYGGTPAQVPFEYLLASVVNVPYAPGLVGTPPLADPSTSLATNLVHLPILSFWLAGDPLVELVAQNKAFATHMKSLGAVDHIVRIEAGIEHDWRSLDAFEACEWLSQHTRAKPSSGSSLGFEDGRLFYFEIEQDQADTFSPFNWNLDKALGVIEIEGTANLAEISVDLDVAEFEPLLTGLELYLRPGDGTQDVIVLEGVAGGPTSVMRDNMPLTSSPGTTWDYDPTMERLTLWEVDGSVTHVWTVTL